MSLLKQTAFQRSMSPPKNQGEQKFQKKKKIEGSVNRGGRKAKTLTQQESRSEGRSGNWN